MRLSTKCWISAFNAQGSRGIIVAVQVETVKIYVAAALGALRKKERQGETQEPSILMVFWVSPPPPLNANVPFCRFFLISPCVWPKSGYWCYLFLTLWISLISWRIMVSFGGFLEDYIFAWWNIWVSIILLLP